MDKTFLYYQAIKVIIISSYVCLFWLTFRFIVHETHWKVAVGSIILSALWLAITKIQMSHFLKTYFDVLSRLEVVIPCTLGIALSAVPILLNTSLELHVIAGFELFLWGSVCTTYRRNRVHYIRQGHGPLPIGTWVSPPEPALQSGDLLLTSGRVAAGLSESVGHAEMVIKMPNNELKAFSSYMAAGLVLNPLSEVASHNLKQGHYIVLRLTHPFTEEQSLKAAQIALDMLKENQEWKDAVNKRRQAIINFLPLPFLWKQKLIKLTTATGYDWLGLFMGRLAKHHWTCIGACLELYRRLGIATHHYGTGLLGFGSGLLDPIMPVRFLDDPAFKLLAVNDKPNQ